MTNLEIDLLNNALDRLMQWGDDTLMRCHAADIEAEKSIMFVCLMHLLATLGVLLGNKNNFLEIMADAYDKAKKEIDKARNDLRST